MERFLPDAQAAAISSLQWAARKHSGPAKQVEVEEGLSYRPYVPSPYRYRPNFVPQDPEQDTNNDDEDNDYAETDNLRKKVCGLLPQFCLMNPLLGMKVRRSLPPPPGRRTISPQTRSSHESVGQAEDEQVPTLNSEDLQEESIPFASTTIFSQAWKNQGLPIILPRCSYQKPYPGGSHISNFGFKWLSELFTMCSWREDQII